MTRLAVLGSPIAHSQSPALHAAAYRVLGLDWEYRAIEVVEGALGAFLDTLDESWRGLSLTMPLKREVLPMLATRSDLVASVGAANTVVIDDAGALHGYNTDVDGMVAALAENGILRLDTVHIVGAGSTAGSALAAAARLGAADAIVTARRIEQVTGLRVLAQRLGIAVHERTFGDAIPSAADLLIDTLPGGVEPPDVEAADRAAALFAVAYDPWPTSRAARWLARGARVVDGLDMLIHQAVGQVRLFTGNDQDEPVPDEAAVIKAMRAAVERS